MRLLPYSVGALGVQPGVPSCMFGTGRDIVESTNCSEPNLTTKSPRTFTENSKGHNKII